jgi:integrase
LLHKASGQARVRIRGRDIYLGKFDSPDSWQKYYRLLADANGSSPGPSQPPENGAAISVAELAAYYVQHAREYYGRTNPDEKHRIKVAIAPLVELYASLPVSEFSPRKFKHVRQRLVDRRNARSHKPLSRYYVNQVASVIKRIFKWGVSEELVPAAVYHSLLTVPSLKKGRTPGVAESKPVAPVPEEHIAPVVAVVSPEVGTMIQLQRLTGMRPDEVTIMRPCDLDTSGDVWCYTIASRFQGDFIAAAGSKTDWRETVDEKCVYLGPQAQTVLRPWLRDKKPLEYLFNPRAVARRYNKALSKKRPPRNHYDDESYCQAVTRGCRRAGVPVWTPGRLRHNAGTSIERQFGIEAARLVLGHRELSTTRIYAERDTAKYRQIIAAVG